MSINVGSFKLYQITEENGPEGEDARWVILTEEEILSLRDHLNETFPGTKGRSVLPTTRPKFVTVKEWEEYQATMARKHNNRVQVSGVYPFVVAEGAPEPGDGHWFLRVRRVDGHNGGSDWLERQPDTGRTGSYMYRWTTTRTPNGATSLWTTWASLSRTHSHPRDRFQAVGDAE